MDFIEWCDHILDKLVQVTAASLDARDIGVDAEVQLRSALYGEHAVQRPEFHTSKARLGIFSALDQWTDMGLVEESHHRFFKPTSTGRRLTVDKTELWEYFCGLPLTSEQEEVLRAVNRLSPRFANDHAWVEWVERDAVLKELGWSGPESPTLLWVASKELEEHHFLRSDRRLGLTIDLQATYRGLVWEHRRGITLESRFVDDLVAEWETTSVDFKRGIRTNTADEKAELIKDIIALANTQASGQRFLVIGFDDRTRKYHGPPDAKITQEHLEQLMSQYTDPVVDVRYEVVAYRAGPVGKLEALRDPKKLPYSVAKSIGDKKRIKQGDMFVRHGSLTEPPTAAELRAIEQEGERARD